MPPDHRRPYGQQPYRDGHGDGYGGDPYGVNPYGQGGDAYEDDPYARRGEFQAAVDALADPLSDPLPGQGAPPPSGYPAQGYTSHGHSPQGQQAQGYQSHRASPEEYAAQQQDGLSPWFRPHREPGAETQSGYVAPPAAPQHPQQQGYTGHAPYGGAPPTRQQPQPQQPQHQRQQTQPQQPQPRQPQPQQPGPYGAPEPGARQSRTDGRVRQSRLSETAALPVVDQPDTAGGERSTADRRRGVEEQHATQTVGLVRPDAEELAGRAARRQASSQRRGRRGSGASEEEARLPAGTRLEARRAARARREGPAIIASRFLGEVFISVGVVMLLFVTYQLWWTNVLAGQEAGGAAQDLQEQWDSGGKGGKGGGKDSERRADSFAPGEGFALLYIPKLDVRVPIAQGVSKPAVLDKGLVGHYDGKPIKSAMPWDKKGNFALAGHRNTHGEPFRYINRLVGGDELVVETATKFYTYKMANRLPSTSPSDTGVIGPIPQQSGFKGPGRYITLTTCTPEFTSKYRLIVWGKMVEERPRSKGKPDALLG